MPVARTAEILILDIKPVVESIATPAPTWSRLFEQCDKVFARAQLQAGQGSGFIRVQGSVFSNSDHGEDLGEVGCKTGDCDLLAGLAGSIRTWMKSAMPEELR